MATPQSSRHQHCLRLGPVEGASGKANDVLFCGKTGLVQGNVVFFGGDVQVHIYSTAAQMHSVFYFSEQSSVMLNLMALYLLV